MSGGAPRGTYQEGLLEGTYWWSGAHLAGKANEYSSSYVRSRESFLRRIQRRLRRSGWDADVPLVLKKNSRRWVRELVISAPGGRLYVW